MPEDLDSLSVADLRLLALLLEERSITRVAALSGQVQPAVSRKLQRLRDVLGDPLLVRSGARMVTTERAAALRAPLREILSQAARLDGGSAFDPAKADRCFHIVSADSLPPAFLPGVIARIVRGGPRLQAAVRPTDPAFDAAKAFEEGDLDLVISNDPAPREDLRIGVLYADEVVCLMRQGHPRAQDRRLSLARYLSLRHLAPHVSAAPRSGPIDGALARTSYQRRIVATVPEFNLAPQVLLASDLVFTTARRFAEHHARQLPLAIVDAPAEIPPMRFYQLWHERDHGSPASRWLRRQVADEAEALAHPQEG